MMIVIDEDDGDDGYDYDGEDGEKKDHNKRYYVQVASDAKEQDVSNEHRRHLARGKT